MAKSQSRKQSTTALKNPSEAAVDKEGNLVTKSITRRERMGHITLAAPVTHIWFMRGTPSALSLLLDLTVKNIEKVVYFATYLITEAKDAEVEKALQDLIAQKGAFSITIPKDKTLSLHSSTEDLMIMLNF